MNNPLIGWISNAHCEHFYWCHCRDWKGSEQLERIDAGSLVSYIRLCATTLAKDHPRSGDRSVLN